MEMKKIGTPVFPPEDSGGDRTFTHDWKISPETRKRIKELEEEMVLAPLRLRRSRILIGSV